jgi:hypothetical protein
MPTGFELSDAMVEAGYRVESVVHQIASMKWQAFHQTDELGYGANRDEAMFLCAKHYHEHYHTPQHGTPQHGSTENSQ